MDDKLRKKLTGVIGNNKIASCDSKVINNKSKIHQ